MTHRIHRFEDAEWHVPVAPGTDPAVAEAAGREGAARRFLAQGDGGKDMICSAVMDASRFSGLGGMVPMYLLMSLFHSPPWLKLIFRQT